MRRRALLAAFLGGTGGLAGCSFSGSDSETVTPAPVPTVETPMRTDESSPNPDPSVDSSVVTEETTSIVVLETVARTYTLHPTRFETADGAVVGLWFDRRATSAHPTRVRGFIENSNDVETTFRIATIPGVGRLHATPPRGTNPAPGLYLAPTAGNEIAETVPEVVRGDDGQWAVESVRHWVPETLHLAESEWAVLEYLLVGEFGPSARPVGHYEFGDGEIPLRVAVWNTDSPGPDEPSRFADRDVPSPVDSRTVTWYHDAGAGTAAFVRPQTERATLHATVDFAMVNHSHERLTCGHLNLYKLVDGRWFHVAPSARTAECHVLEPGGRVHWTLRAFNGAVEECGAGCDEGLTRGYLGGGTYGGVVDYGVDADASGALLELAGDRVEIVPTPDATIERDGVVAVVTTDRHGDGEGAYDASLTLRRVADADERLIAEQVMGGGGPLTSERGLRNALAGMAPGIERVVLRTDVLAVDGAVGLVDVDRRFSVRGQAYEVRRGGEA